MSYLLDVCEYTYMCVPFYDFDFVVAQGSDFESKGD